MPNFIWFVLGILVGKFLTWFFEQRKNKINEILSDEKVDTYKCQSYVEGGVVKDCTCGKCF